jgi:hypothetical protein
MLSTLPVGQQACPRTMYQLTRHEQAMHLQAWQPRILLAAIAAQPP